MSKATKTLVIISLALLLLSAQKCEKKQETVKAAYGFIGGTSGLDSLFVSGQPPEKVLDAGNEPFVIAVQHNNNGEYDIKENEIVTTLEGISFSTFSINKPTQTNDISLPRKILEKATKSVIQGGQAEAVYDASYKDDISFDKTHTIAVNVCYKYQTKAVSSLCLVNNPTQRHRETDVCLINEGKPVGNSGAPLQATTLSQRASGKNEVIFTFQIENKGTGSVYAPSLIQKKECTDRANEDILDWAQVSIQSPEGLPLECAKLNNGAEGQVRLIKGLTTISCKLDTSKLTQAAPFTSEVLVTLDYAYKTHFSKQITVENVG